MKACEKEACEKRKSICKDKRGRGFEGTEENRFEKKVCKSPCHLINIVVSRSANQLGKNSMSFTNHHHQSITFGSSSCHRVSQGIETWTNEMRNLVVPGPYLGEKAPRTWDCDLLLKPFCHQHANCNNRILYRNATTSSGRSKEWDSNLLEQPLTTRHKYRYTSIIGTGR